MPFNGWDAYVFLHISICALKKQQSVLKVAHLNMTAAGLLCFPKRMMYNYGYSIDRSKPLQASSHKEMEINIGSYTYLTHSAKAVWTGPLP